MTAAAAALLWASRGSFYVRHEPATLRSALWRLPLLAAGVFLASLAAVAFAAPDDRLDRGDLRAAPATCSSGSARRSRSTTSSRGCRSPSR